MKFRTGLVVGIGVGYVLGARAGRERYEQIKRAAAKAREKSQAVRKRASKAERDIDKLNASISAIVTRCADVAPRDRSRATSARRRSISSPATRKTA